MMKVEAQAIGCDERSRLRHVLAEHLAKRGVQQMRRGVIALGVAPPIGGHVRVHVPEAELARELADRDVATVDLLHLIDRDAPSVTDDLADIRDLPAGLRVERRVLQYERDAIRRKPTRRH